MAAQERRDDLVDVPRRRPAEDADRHRAAPQRGELVDAVGGVLDGAQAAGGVLGEREAGVGEHHAAPRTDEEVGAERVLELADLLRDRGLADAQRRGGGREGAKLDRRAEAADLQQRHKLSFGDAPGSRGYLAGSRVLLLEAGDRLGGRMRSEVRGDYWLNYGAHLFPAPGSLVDRIARECGLETVPVTGGMMGLAVGSTVLDRGRVETYPLRLPLSMRERIAFARAGLRIQRAVKRYHRRREQRHDFEDDRTLRAPRPAADRGGADLRLRRASRDGGARRALGRLRHRPVRARVGWHGLADRAQPARRTGQLPAAMGRELGNRARTGCPVHAVRPDGADLVVDADGEEIRARQVIVAAPAPHA
jgi:hypothetical protein